jgi:hypothetical protein
MLNKISYKDSYLSDNGTKMENKKILKLNLQWLWFCMILQGCKKEEYREVKKFWMSRIAHLQSCGTSYDFTILAAYGFNNIKHGIYDYIEFKNGYREDSPVMLVECKGIVVDQGKKVWGAPSYRTFVIKLGKILWFNMTPEKYNKLPDEVKRAIAKREEKILKK